MPLIGVISNPASRVNRRRGMAEIDSAVAEAPDVVHRALPELGALPETLDDFAARGVDLLVVNGGDGTVQLTLTDLLERRPFARLPILALLPRGTTNMTAADIGIGDPRGRGLAKVIGLARARDLSPHLRERRVLRVEHALDTPPQRGLFFGAAGICRAIELCRREAHRLELAADWAAGLTLAGILGRWALGGGKAIGFTGARISLSLDAAPAATGERFLVLATTLRRLVLGSRPFWNEDGRAFRLTSIAYPPRHLLANAPKVLYGWPNRHLPEGYVSHDAQQAALRLPDRFTLDGEFFDPDPERPLVLSAPESVRFLCP